MLYRDLFVDHIQHLHSKSCVSRNSLSIDLADIKLCGIYQCEETSAEGNREFDFFSVDSYGLVLFVNKCRNVCQCNALNFSVFYDSLCTDQSGRSIENYVILTFVCFYKTSLNSYGNCADGAVSAHVQVSACIHEHYSEVSLFVDWLAQECSEHIMMSSWLEHQSGTNVVVIFLHPFFLLDHGIALRLRESADDHTAELTFGMSVYNLKSCLKPVKVDIRF